MISDTTNTTLLDLSYKPEAFVSKRTMNYSEGVIVGCSGQRFQQPLVTLFHGAATSESAGVVKSSGQLMVRSATSAIRQRCKRNIEDEWRQGDVAFAILRSNLPVEVDYGEIRLISLVDDDQNYQFRTSYYFDNIICSSLI